MRHHGSLPRPRRQGWSQVDDALGEAAVAVPEVAKPIGLWLNPAR